MGHEELREAMAYIVGANLSINHNGQALSTEFVENCQYLDWTTVVCAVYHEVTGP